MQADFLGNPYFYCISHFINTIVIMAKILLGDRIADIRGSIGGTTYSRNTFANYIRNKTSPVNPNTVAQQLVRARFGAASQAWAGLTEAERQAWNDGAQAWTNTNVFNQSIQYTGFALFNRLSRNLQEVSEAIITSFSLPASVDSFVTLSVVADTTAGTMILAFTDAIAATHKVIVQATNPVSAGVSFVKSEFRQITVFDSTDLTGVDVAAFYIATFGALPPVGAKVFLQMKQILIANGQNGVPLRASDIAI